MVRVQKHEGCNSGDVEQDEDADKVSWGQLYRGLLDESSSGWSWGGLSYWLCAHESDQNEGYPLHSDQLWLGPTAKHHGPE